MKPGLINYKVPSLISYAHLRKIDSDGINYLVKNPHTTWLLDSGAFTALNTGTEIRLEDYMQFLDTYKSYIKDYIALDVIGNPEATDKNLRIMLDNGFKPIPVHVRNDSKQRMDELFTLSDWVALGGMRRPHSGVCPPEFVKLKMDMAEGRKVHWLGYTSMPQINLYKPFSCDSSSCAAARRYGSMYIYLSNLRMTTREFKDLKKNRLATIEKLIEEAGFSYEELTKRENWHGWNSASSQVSNYSWIKLGYECSIKNGTRIYLATVPGVIRDLYFSIDQFFGTSYREGLPKCF